MIAEAARVGHLQRQVSDVISPTPLMVRRAVRRPRNSGAAFRAFTMSRESEVNPSCYWRFTFSSCRSSSVIPSPSFGKL
jgi:hypothetical protein